jgi:hypothetical protein
MRIMGTLNGKTVDPAMFSPFLPAKMLYDVGGARSFTFVPSDGELYWAHWFDESIDRVRYLVVPFSSTLLARLESGRVSLLDALDQPRLWVVDVDNQGVPIFAIRTTLADLPCDELPMPGTMLTPSLERPVSTIEVGEDHLSPVIS